MIPPQQLLNSNPLLSKRNTIRFFSREIEIHSFLFFKVIWRSLPLNMLHQLKVYNSWDHASAVIVVIKSMGGTAVLVHNDDCALSLFA